MRKSQFLASISIAAAAVALVPAAASAAVSGPAAAAVTAAHRPRPAAGGSDPSTTVTFTVNVGTLSISVPAAADLGTGAPGQSNDGQLGTVSVADSRALLSASWTTTVSSSAFVTGTGTPNETIPATAVAYDPGTITTSGVITITTHDVSLSGTPQAVVAGSAGVGNNTASWNPTLNVVVPGNAVGGTYTGTVTHSVA
jgi:hypothetical protein